MKLSITASRLSFILPYIKRELPGYDIVEGPAEDADFHTAVIEPDETLPASLPATATVLKCPMVVGTRMTGFPMEMARRIADGSHFHIEGSDAHVSTIHASAVAQAVRLSLGVPGQFKVTDGSDPTWRELADALAHRIKDKRILSLKPILARFIMPRALRRRITADELYDGSGFAERFSFHPTPVTEYLSTHNYDDDSL